MAYVCCIAVLGGNSAILAHVERPYDASYASFARLHSVGVGVVDLRRSSEGYLLSWGACAHSRQQNGDAEAYHLCEGLNNQI